MISDTIPTRNKQTWDSTLYDDKMSFVSKFGKGVIELLYPQPGEKILDLGCGTGDLTKEISTSGAIVTGMDNSASMLEKARQKYPDLEFLLGDGETFRTAKEYDAVFSNAALHWMKRPAEVITSVWLALKSGGRFVAEFGGKGNVQIIKEATQTVLDRHEINTSQINPWYYPSIGEYASLLEQQGFRVPYAVHFDRSTQLEGGENGLRHWLDMFSGAFFSGLPDNKKSELYAQIEDEVRPKLFRDGSWFADYVRIRVMARKN